MTEKFTIEEIRNYIITQDSLGDVCYNLSEKSIRQANKKITFTLEDIHGSGNWDSFCEKYGYNAWAINEGGGDVEVNIFVSDAKKYNLI